MPFKQALPDEVTCGIHFRRVRTLARLSTLLCLFVEEPRAPSVLRHTDSSISVDFVKHGFGLAQ